MRVRPQDIKKGDRVKVRYNKASDQTVFTGIVTETDVKTCSETHHSGHLTVQLDEGQGRSFVSGIYSVFNEGLETEGLTWSCSIVVEEVLPKVVEEMGLSENVIITKKPRDARGRFVRVPVEV